MLLKILELLKKRQYLVLLINPGEGIFVGGKIMGT